MPRPLRTAVSAAVAVIALVLCPPLMPAGVGVSRASDIKRCTIAQKGESPVAKACVEGGVDSAKATMKRMLGIARGKQKGRHWACDDCHLDEETWKLTDEARQGFKELLTLVADEAPAKETAK